MNNIFFSIGMSLDGFIAGPNGGPDNPLGNSGTKIHEWMYSQQAFLDNLELDPHFKATVQFDEQKSDTKVNMQMLFPTTEVRKEAADSVLSKVENRR